MSIRASCASLESSRRVMLVASPEKNRHRKSDDGSEANPPREFQQGQPIRLGVELAAEKFGDLVWQAAENRDHDKPNDHREDVASIVSASFGQHAGEKYSENRAVGITVNPEHDRNNAHIRINDDDVSSR